MSYTLYGEGGYDPSKPNNNIVEQVIDDEPAEAADSVREAAMAKLQALGLTPEEIQALLP